MNLKRLIKISAVFCMLIASSQTFASGGSSEDNEDTGFGESSGFESAERVVDPIYESGKAIYTGRKKTIPKLSYCLSGGEEGVVKVKRKSIKQFKKTSYSELAKNLYQCDVPSSSIKSQLEGKDFIHVLYYLDKRYKLKLQRS